MQRLLVCFGNAEHGRLGLGSHLTSQNIPRLCTDLAKFHLQQVSCGGAHTVVATRSGLVFSFGLNSLGQLGHSPDDASVHTPRTVNLPDAAQQVASGAHHTLVLTEEGQVFAFGSNEHGQLGLGPHHGSHSAPALVEGLKGERVVSVAAGAQHSLAVTDKGQLFSWGASERGRLGLGEVPPGPVWLPQHVCTGLDDTRLVSAAAGAVSSSALDRHGQLWCWGANAMHQLGLGEGTQDRLTPEQVPGVRRIKKVSMGMVHALATREDGRTLIWGSDVVGCLGQAYRGVWDAKVSEFIKPAIFKYWFTDVSCGPAHSAGVSADGRLYTWGWGGITDTQVPKLTGQTAHSQSSSHQHQSSSGYYQSSNAHYTSSAGQHQAYSSARHYNSGSSAEQIIVSGTSRIQFGSGQLGVGSGQNLKQPTLVSRVEITPGKVFRQDGGDPFNYQDENLAWMFRQVSCGANHTAAIVEVGVGFTGAVQGVCHELDKQLALAG